MLKKFYFSTTLLFVLINIFLLPTTMPRKRSNRRALQNARFKRRKLKITASVQGIDAVEQIHQAETNTVPVQAPVQGIEVYFSLVCSIMKIWKQKQKGNKSR